MQWRISFNSGWRSYIGSIETCCPRLVERVWLSDESRARGLVLARPYNNAYVLQHVQLSIVLYNFIYTTISRRRDRPRMHDRPWYSSIAVPVAVIDSIWVATLFPASESNRIDTDTIYLYESWAYLSESVSIQLHVYVRTLYWFSVMYKYNNNYYY